MKTEKEYELVVYREELHKETYRIKATSRKQAETIFHDTVSEGTCEDYRINEELDTVDYEVSSIIRVYSEREERIRNHKADRALCNKILKILEEQK